MKEHFATESEDNYSMYDFKIWPDAILQDFLLQSSTFVSIKQSKFPLASYYELVGVYLVFMFLNTM